MTETKERQQILASKILEVCCNDKISRHISLMEYTLETINYIQNTQVQAQDLEIFRGLINESLQYGALERISMSNHYKKFYRLTNEIKNELKTIPVLTEEEPITELNSWIRSLKIFKISEMYNELEEKTYQTSYELYQAMRKIILKKGSTKCKKIYVGMIVEKLEKESTTLPKNIQIYEIDYELSQIIKLVKNSEEFGYNHKSISVLSDELRNRLDRHSRMLRVKMLVKE